MEIILRDFCILSYKNALPYYVYIPYMGFYIALSYIYKWKRFIVFFLTVFVNVFP